MKIKFRFFQTGVLYRTFSHPTEEKIFNFSLLKAGWNYGEGEDFSNEAIREAMELHREIIFRGFSRTDAFPGLDGEIQVTIYEGEHYFAFEREKIGTWSVTHEVNNNQVDAVPGLNFEQVKKHLASTNSILCSACDYYRGETIGTRYVEDLTTWPSNREIVEYPSSEEIVA
jgi:hypothetical protein